MYRLTHFAAYSERTPQFGIGALRGLELQRVVVLLVFELYWLAQFAALAERTLQFRFCALRCLELQRAVVCLF